MKKFKRLGILLASMLCVGTAAAGLAACGEEEQPTEQGGSSTTLVTNKAPDELTPENAIYAFLQKQSELSSYKITTEGLAVADLAGYKQEIHNATYKNGSDYLNHAKSNSVLVNMEHQSFSKDGQVVYRDGSKGELKVATKEEYKKVYGFTADDITLGGYIINDKTLRYAKLEKTEGDVLTYYFRLAGDLSKESGAATESGTAAVRVQSKAYGSLDNTPAFSDVDIYLKIKKDWTPVSYTSECSYDCKKVLNMSVKQTLTSTYSDVNKTVEIPGAAEFAAQIGSTPSEVKPIQAETSTLMQLTSALGGAIDEKETLSLPVSVDVDLFGAPISMDGDITLKIKREELNGGDVLNAFTLRLDLGLEEIPLLSQAVNTFTVRYVGDGVLLLMLNNRADGKDNYLFTYALDLNTVLPSGSGLDLSLENSEKLLENTFDLEKTDAGFHIALKQSYVEMLGAKYDEMIEGLDATLGDHGYISSLLGSALNSLTVDLAGTDKITGIALSVTGTPTGNVTMGEKIDVSIDSALLGGAIQQTPITGELQLRLDPTVLWTGDYYAVAQASLHLDVTPLGTLLGMVGAFAPAGTLPSYVNGNLKSVDVYYTGDGLLTVAFNNKNDQTVGVINVDLKETISGGAPDLGGSLPSLDLLPLTFTVAQNGLTIALGEPIVTMLDTLYGGVVDGLIEQAVAGAGAMGSAAKGLLTSYLKAKITGVELFLGTNEEGKPALDLAVKGARYDTEEDGQVLYKAENVRLLGIKLNYNEELIADERDELINAAAVKAVREANAKAQPYVERLQDLIDNMDLTEEGMQAYADKVTAIKTEIDGLPEEVQLLISNKSCLDETEFSDKNNYIGLITTQKAYRTRVEAFEGKLPAEDDYSQFSEANWNELNNLYDNAGAISWGGVLGLGGKSIALPAVKDCPAMIKAIGEVRIEAYKTAREKYEREVAEALLAEINGLKGQLDGKTSEEELKEVLTTLVKDIKQRYAKVAEGKKSIVSAAYDEYVLAVCTKNLQMIADKYAALKTEFDAFFAEEDASIDGLIPLLEKFSDIYAWHGGWDYWTSSAKSQAWGGAWDTALRDTLQEGSKPILQEEIEAANQQRNTFLQGGETAKKIITQFGEEIKTKLNELMDQLTPCRTKVGYTMKYDFKSLGTNKQQLSQMLETMRGLRFLFEKSVSTEEKKAFLVDGSELYTFTTSDLKNFEKNLDSYVQKLSD